MGEPHADGTEEQHGDEGFLTRSQQGTFGKRWFLVSTGYGLLSKEPELKEWLLLSRVELRNDHPWPGVLLCVSCLRTSSVVPSPHRETACAALAVGKACSLFWCLVMIPAQQE